MVVVEDSICERITPKAGMVFNSEEEVYDFYVKYAQQEGFGITKRTTKSEDGRKLKYYALACIRGGKRTSTAKDSFKPRLSTKTNCQARVNVIVDNDGYFTIFHIHFEHNHALNAKPIEAYGVFGDVISFDTIYLTNKYDMSLTLFVGEKHHGQTLLFEYGLLSKEDTETYIWLFRTWLECMLSKAPNAIITYQFMDIQGVVRTAFPNFHHRFCLWHIMKKIPEKLAYINENFKLFQDELRGMIYCNLAFINLDGPICTFLVAGILRGKEGILRKQVVFNVQHNDLEFDIKRSCHLFELIKKNVKEIPAHYILTNWRKEVKHRHTYVKNCYNETQIIEQKVRYNKLCAHFSKATRIGVESNEKCSWLAKSFKSIYFTNDIGGKS
ncbi:FHY3/FAR1 family protein [Dioscorea alata]|uniref:FHY3/FAR1 family protein n=1 Tax=Dioscorea alata TaxID=55571 RepID=A0ACB7URA1_DIOAL|nr:FHY3/FAR1 family protein [Dioscorea alata]